MLNSAAVVVVVAAVDVGASRGSGESARDVAADWGDAMRGSVADERTFVGSAVASVVSVSVGAASVAEGADSLGLLADSRTFALAKAAPVAVVVAAAVVVRADWELSLHSRVVQQRVVHCCLVSIHL